MNDIVFLSMNAFGHACLEHLLCHQKRIDLIITLEKKRASSISDFQDFTSLAETCRIPLIKIHHIKEVARKLKMMHPAVIFVLGWSQILPNHIFSLPKYGTIGAHPALLPKNRGRAVIPWHFIHEERYGGITFFYLDEGVDSGPIIAQKRFRINDTDNASSYYQKITELDKKELLARYDALTQGKVSAKKQNGGQATYLTKRTPKDSFLNFFSGTKTVHNQIRAVSSIYPLAYFFYKGKRLYVTQSLIRHVRNRESLVPGKVRTIHGSSLIVETTDGIIELISDIIADIQPGAILNE